MKKYDVTIPSKRYEELIAIESQCLSVIRLIEKNTYISVNDVLVIFGASPLPEPENAKCGSVSE